MAFGLKWFLPSIIKFKKSFLEVLVGAFALQILGLGAPLVTQVIVDNVIMHKSFSTLNVLMIGLVLIAAFKMLLGIAKNYVFTHTTNRIDVILNARLFEHLFRLPLMYFETEQYRQSQNSITDEAKKYHEELMTLLVQKDKEILVAESQFNKASTLSNMNTIVAPVDGQINGLGTNAVGSVVSASNPIMTIVPNDTPLIIEAIVANQDIGFVYEGQAVDIKVDTFPFQKYGTIDGIISFVSPDAYQDEKLGSVYKIRVTPKQKGLKINDKLMNLSSGMATTVEVKTGKRRIIEFFIPAIDFVKDSFELR